MHCLNIKLAGYGLYLDAYKVNIMNNVDLGQLNQLIQLLIN